MTTLTAPPTRRGAGALRAAGVFVERSLRQNLRDGEALLMAVLLPVLLMLVFTYVFGGAIDPTGAYLSYVVPGIILTCAGFGASGVAVSVNRDVTTGAINRFRTMPIAGATVLVGHVVASLLRNLVATGLVIGVGVALGFRPDATPLEWVGAVGVVGLYILAITALFAFIGLVAGSPESANGYGFLLLFLPYASSAFVPVETMPSWLRGFSEHQPITPVIETIRGLLTGTEIGTAGPLALVWCVGVVLVAGLLVALTFPRRLRR